MKFGPRWPLQEPSRGQERQVRHWCATDEAKALPNPFRQRAKDYAAQMSDDERLFWKEVRQEFGAVFFDGNEERSSEKDKRLRGL